MKSPIHIAIAFDENYRQPAFALVSSIMKHHTKNDIAFHAITTGITEGDRNQLRSYLSDLGASIIYYQVDEAVVRRFVLGAKWTPAVYYRLFFPFLVNRSIQRLLYLDSDIIVNGNLRALYEKSMEQYPLAAVYDVYVKKQLLIGIHEGQYFNSGVLLMDLERWRDQQVSERTSEYLLKFPERILFVDQCALNAVLAGNWQKLSEKYNLLYSYIPEGLSRKELNRFVSDKVIIHFTLQRPWNFLCKNRLKSLYYYYLKSTPVGKTAARYTDFEWSKVPAYLKIKLLHLYFDLPIFPKLWRTLKTLGK